MSSYRRYVARHGAAIHRAKQQIRRHAWETPPAPVAPEEKWAEQTFQDFARRWADQPFVLQVVDPGGSPRAFLDALMPGIPLTEPDPVLAYRGKHSGALRCVRCVGPGLIKLSVPLTSDDLPDGGICRVCGVDVLIPVVKR